MSDELRVAKFVWYNHGSENDEAALINAQPLLQHVIKYLGTNSTRLTIKIIK